MEGEEYFVFVFSVGYYGVDDCLIRLDLGILS